MLRVTTSIVIDAPRDLVSEIYADYLAWPRLFPTISGVRLLHRDGEKLVLEVDHVEGKVRNELLVRSPDDIELWEDKRHYRALFRNQFRAVPGGTRFTVTGYISLKGWGQAPATGSARVRTPPDGAVSAAPGQNCGRGTRPPT